MGYFQRYTGDSHFHLIPCEARTEKVKELAELLFQISSSSVYIKKISQRQRDELLSIPDFKVVDQTNGWYQEAPQEDDTFPEQILEVKITLTELLKSRKESQVKDKYVRALRRYGKELQIEQYNADNQEQRRIAFRLVDKFFAIQEEKDKHLSLPQDYFNLIGIKPLHTAYWSSLFYIEKGPAAFYFAERHGNTAHLYANITLHDRFPYLSEFIIIHLLQEITKAGVQKMNPGGSETVGLDRFKQKFKPIEEKKMYWVLY